MKKGFTLMELLVVIIIVGVLAALALPNYAKMVKASYAAEAWAHLSSLLKARKVYYMKSGMVTWTTDISLLDIDNPNSTTYRKFSYSMTGTDASSLGFWACPIDITGAVDTTRRMYGISCATCGSEGEQIARYDCGCTAACAYTTCVTIR